MAALNAFWKFPQPVLQKAADDLGLVPKSPCLWDVVETLVRHECKDLSELDFLAIMEKRCVPTVEEVPPGISKEDLEEVAGVEETKSLEDHSRQGISCSKLLVGSVHTFCFVQFWYQSLPAPVTRPVGTLILC